MIVSTASVSSGVRAQPMGSLMAGQACPDPFVAAAVQRQLQSGACGTVPHGEMARAVARERGRRALVQARRLYTRTNFTGCIAALSISELELSRFLADVDPDRQQRAHQLLARVTLWLGICQWAAGEHQAAARSFVQSSQLPRSPIPDPGLLPPELIQAYREAVAAPRQVASCALELPLTAEDLQVNGKGPTVAKGALELPVGTHYIVLTTCRSSSSRCALTGEAGPGRRSLRFEATAHACRLRQPPRSAPARTTCISLDEAADPSFIGRITAAVHADRTLLVVVSKDRLVARLYRAGASGFHHQLESSLRTGEPVDRVLRRSIRLLLAQGGQDLRTMPPGGRSGRSAWYTKWWVWTLGAVAVASVVTVVSLAAQEDRVTVVVGR